MVGSTVSQGRACSQFHRSVFVAVDTRGISGVSDVENDSHTRLEAKRGHARAKTANLFLNRIKTVDSGSTPGRQGGKIGENLADDEAADAIIDGASDNLPRHQFFRRIRVHRRMTRANPPFFHFFSRISTDVYIQLVYLRDFIVFFVAKVNRGVSDHTKHRPFATQNLDPFTPGDCSITPTDTGEIDESFVRDVLNHTADFVALR